MEQELIVRKIENIENDLNRLKKLVLSPKKTKIVSLKGMLKGMKTSEKDIEEAKRSLFKA